MRVFVAGGTGVIGRSLIPMLTAAGHEVTGTTRSAGRAGLLRALGAEPVVADGLDGGAVLDGVTRARPEVIIHQMTALSGAADLRNFDRTFAVTNELRTGHRLPAGGRAGRRHPAVHRAELHRLAERPRRRPGQDRGRPARPGPARQHDGIAAGDPAPRGGRPGPGAGRSRAALRHLVRARGLRGHGRPGAEAPGCRSSAGAPASGRSRTSPTPPRHGRAAEPG